MMLRLSVLAILACALLTGTAQAACVGNATQETLLFTIEARGSTSRVESTVAPGGLLCLAETSGAVLRVFASPDEIEGCARLVGSAGRDSLIAFRRYDNCRWASHGR